MRLPFGQDQVMQSFRRRFYRIDKESLSSNYYYLYFFSKFCEDIDTLGIESERNHASFVGSICGQSHSDSTESHYAVATTANWEVILLDFEMAKKILRSFRLR